MNRNMATAVISGGAGFLGSHLCDRLIKDGQSVICLDNLLTGSVDNIAHLIGTSGFRFVNCDVSEEVSLEERVDFVYHCASPASPADFVRLPIEILKAGSFGTHSMLELAMRKKARFLLASSSEVYGDPQVHPQPESYWGNVNSIGPRSVYDESKRYAEAVTMAYHRYRKVDTRIARIFNTFGERMRVDDGRAIPSFIAQALRGHDIIVFGDGKQTRSVSYVSDTIEGLLKLMKSDYCLPMNIGNPEEITIHQLAEEIIMLSNSKSKIAHKALPEDDPKLRQPDVRRAKDVLKWETLVSRHDGLTKTIQYFRTAGK
jgi:dTDP-glucose 4,6-dehydratase